jgi:hypothetical protein
MYHFGLTQNKKNKKNLPTTTGDSSQYIKQPVSWNLKNVSATLVNVYVQVYGCWNVYRIELLHRNVQPKVYEHKP